MNWIRNLAVSAVLGSALAVTSAQAAVISITYTATTFPSGVTSETGSGTATYTPNSSTPNSVSLGDLSGFSFVLTEDGNSGVSTNSYGLSDLVGFSATLDGAGNVTALSLDTGPFGFGSGTGLYANEALSFTLPTGDTYNGDVGTYSTGRVTASPASSVPEPATLAVLGLALAGLGLAKWPGH